MNRHAVEIAALAALVLLATGCATTTQATKGGIKATALQQRIGPGGLTPEEVAAVIKEELSEYIRDPNVTVLLTALRSHEYISRIRITGAVNQPLSIPYRQGITILDAVLAAGGVNQFASADKAKLHRTENGETTIYDIPLGRILTQGDINANIRLQPGDVITVPERLF